MLELNYYCHPDAIVLWWEKPVAATPDWNYRVELDDSLMGKTPKTHYTLAGLEASREYTLRLSALAHDNSVQHISEMIVHTPASPVRIDVTSAPFYAKGDGETLNTVALQQAIDACPMGGSVYVPAGIYLTGALRLHSHMELYLEEGAVLQGSSNPQDYLPRIHSRFEGIEMECYQSLLNLGHLNHEEGYNCTDVILRGKGTIRGGGYDLAWATIESERELLKDYLAENAAYIATCENNNTIPGRVRGRLINMSNCQNIRISGLTLAEGASWNVHMIYSDNIITDHCTFRSQGIWNGDGWDPDSSTNCTLFACEFYTGDDSVAIKSGKNPEGNLINRPTKHIRIFDCFCHFGHGLCMGSEMSGGIEDVKIWDCNIEKSLNGIEMKGTSKRGGFIRNIEVRDCIVPRLLAHAVPYNNDGIPAPHPPIFENYTFERVTVTGRSFHTEGYKECTPIELRGFDKDAHAVKNVLFKNVTLPPHAEICTELCSNIRFED